MRGLLCPGVMTVFCACSHVCFYIGQCEHMLCAYPLVCVQAQVCRARIQAKGHSVF